MLNFTHSLFTTLIVKFGNTICLDFPFTNVLQTGVRDNMSAMLYLIFYHSSEASSREGQFWWPKTTLQLQANFR